LYTEPRERAKNLGSQTQEIPSPRGRVERKGYPTGRGASR
jgi:hypothetical protein